MLRNRWLKKSGQQRRKVLLAAFPNIPAIHRPDFEALRKETQEQTRAGTRFHDTFLLPSINLEDLMKPKNLILFMHSRGRNKPDVFVNSDFNSIHLATIAAAIVPSYISGYTMLLSGQMSATTYGQLVAWDDDPEAFDMMSNGRGVQPGEGLLILEIQQKKLDFLSRCAQNILHDLPLQDTSVPKQSVPAVLVLANEDSEWPSLTKEVLEAPYRVPDQFDFARLQSFVSAKRAEAEDHIWSLREDPSYFKDAVFEWSEHRQEKLPSINDKPHPILRRDEFWERVLSNMVIEAYGALLLWDQLEKDARHLESLRKMYGDEIGRYSDLPEDYENALCHFTYFVEQTTKGQLNLWKTGMVAPPPLRKHFVREPQDSDKPNMIHVRERRNSHSEKDHFRWLVGRLTMDDQLFLCGLDNVVDELERLIRSDQNSRERLSSWLADILSNLSLLAETKRQIGLFHPGAPMMEALSLTEQQTEYTKKTQLLSEIFGVLSKGLKLAVVGTPLTKFNHPSDKRRTAAVTQQMQEAEQHLGLFWKEVDDHVLHTGGKSLTQLLSGTMTEREIQRTEDWKEPEPPVQLQDPNIQNITHALFTTDLERRTENTISPDSMPEVKSKNKTRGMADPPKAAETIQEDQPAHHTTEQTPMFTVSKRGYKVFSALFFIPSEEEPPRELPWSDFLSAMASVGFSIKSLDGSAWIFSPRTDLFQRSIIFHEPHPSSKIPFRTARRFGRRLERAFGWTAANFVRG